MPTALITGGSRGLGETYARELAERGYSVVLVARDHDRLAATAERIGRATGAIVEILAADLTDLTGPAGLAAVERRIADPDLPVRLLVQAARCAPGGPVTFRHPNAQDGSGEWIAPDTTNTEGISFVPRDDIEGRALMVFYPARPFSWLFGSSWPDRFGFVR